jgi:hypothetical protein
MQFKRRMPIYGPLPGNGKLKSIVFLVIYFLYPDRRKHTPGNLLLKERVIMFFVPYGSFSTVAWIDDYFIRQDK